MIKVSVIVCTYNRDKYLPLTLNHLRDQSQSFEEYEIVIVNNNSTDSTDRICRDFIAEQNSLNITYVIEINQGHTYARNRGIAESKGKYLAFIDDDAFVVCDYVKNIITFFDSHPKVAAIGGKIIPVYESIEPKWMSKYLLPLVAALDMGNNIIEFKKRKFPIGANMAYRSEVFKNYGVFDVNLGRRGNELEGGDEKDMIFRIKGKEKIYYVPDVLVHHVIPDKRLTMTYIKGMAKGVSSSEKKRLKKLGTKNILSKILEEAIKITGTFVLATKYVFTFQGQKASMLLKFRYWIIREYLFGNE